MYAEPVKISQRPCTPYLHGMIMRAPTGIANIVKGWKKNMMAMITQLNKKQTVLDKRVTSIENKVKTQEKKEKQKEDSLTKEMNNIKQNILELQETPAFVTSTELDMARVIKPARKQIGTGGYQEKRRYWECEDHMRRNTSRSCGVHVFTYHRCW